MEEVYNFIGQEIELKPSDTVVIGVSVTPLTAGIEPTVSVTFSRGHNLINFVNETF